jgi:hypothetical protein
MIARIRNHIRAFGAKFIVAEFGLSALGAGGLAVYFLVTAHFVLALVAAGIMLNCVPLLAYGLRALVNKEAGRSARPGDQQTLKDTLALSAALSLPFGLLAATVYEAWREGQKHKR